MAQKRKKKKKRTPRERGSASSGGGESSEAGGTMSGMRSGFKGIVGTGKKKKESPLSKTIWIIVLAAAIGLLIYRFTR